jgi:hypothetical protein
MNRGRPRTPTKTRPSRRGAQPPSKTLNIKSPKVYEKAARLADLTGATMTSAIETALEEALARHQAEVQAKIERILELAHEVNKHLPSGLTREEIDREMYDEYGLPR